MSIEIVYARSASQESIDVPFVYGMSARDALELSGLVRRYPELQTEVPALGRNGVRIESTTELSDGDRVEVLRPLRVRPEEARRARQSPLR